MGLPLPESCCRGTQLLAFRAAAIEKWGDLGWKETCALLGDEARDALLRPVRPVEWVPERHMVSLADAVFTGPAAKSEQTYREFVRHQIDYGFGRVRRMLLHLMPPEIVLSRAPDLWRHDHTHGELVVDVASDKKRAHVRLVDHVHATYEVGWITSAEMFRYVLALTRAKHVTSAHRSGGDRILEIDLEWQ